MDEIEDQNDSTWAQASDDEQRMLTEDPGYFQFLANIANHQETNSGLSKY
jgi:hypothetical protein